MEEVNQPSESEKVIRRLYEITNNYDKGFEFQITELLKMGLQRFNLDIGILSHIEGKDYVVTHVVCPDEVPLTSGATFAFDHTYCMVTCAANGPIAIENVGESDLLGSHPAYRDFGLESYIGIPIKCDGQTCGTLNFSSPNPYPRRFRDIDIDSLQLMASWIEVELIRRAQQQKLEELNNMLEQQSKTDPLTQLPNRRYLFEYMIKGINHLSRRNAFGALVIIDIDHFKLINDNYGHLKGDEVLASVSASLKDVVRDYDFVGRYGGEEFILWMEDVSLDEVSAVCERVKENVSLICLDEKTVTVSMGVSYFSCNSCRFGDYHELLDRLIHRADQALYEAKSKGRDCVVYASREPLNTSDVAEAL